MWEGYGSSVPLQRGEYLLIKGKGEKRREEGYTHLMHTHTKQWALLARVWHNEIWWLARGNANNFRHQSLQPVKTADGDKLG